MLTVLQQSKNFSEGFFMKLYELLEGNVQTELDNIEIKGITDDTRKVSEGYIFVCIKGEKFDGHEYAEKRCISRCCRP